MADFIIFNEGKDFILSNNLYNAGARTIYFLLSTSLITTTLTATSTLAGGVGEITGTGYARKSQLVPAPSNGIMNCALMSWSTGAAVDWPATTRTIIAVTTSDNTGKALWAQHLQAGGTPYDMSIAGATLNVTPTAFLQNIGGG